MKLLIFYISLFALFMLNEACINSNELARIDDTSDPAGRITWMCANRISKYQGRRGHFRITGGWNNCDILIDFARRHQSWRRNWHLSNEIICGDTHLTIT